MTSTYRQPAPSGYNRTFTGKSKKIQEQHTLFWEQPGAAADVRAYMCDIKNHRYTSGSRSDEDQKKWVQPDTIFRSPDDTKLAHNEEAMIIGNSASFSVAQYQGHPERAGMSVMHLLGIPKRAIFNGVSLNHHNIDIIDDMIALFKASWKTKTFREEAITHQAEVIRRRVHHQINLLGKEREAHNDSEAMRHEIEEGGKTAEMQLDQLRDCIHNTKPDDFQFGLHLWSDQSIGHLHLHIIAAPKHLRQFSSTENDDKTVDALEVRDYIKSIPPDHVSNKFHETGIAHGDA